MVDGAGSPAAVEGIGGWLLSSVASRPRAKSIGAFIVAAIVALTSAIVAPAPAQAVATGTITGTVSAPAGFADPDWWRAVTVVAEGQQTVKVSIGPSGNYAITGLTKPMYEVRVEVGTYSLPSGEEISPNLLDVSYPDAVGDEGREPVYVSAGSTTLGIDFHLREGGTLTGHVDVPAGVEDFWWRYVEVYAAGPRGFYGYLNSEGDYFVNGIVPGEYTLHFDPTFFNSNRINGPELIEEWYDNSAFEETSQPVVIAAGETTVANASLAAKVIILDPPVPVIVGTPAIGKTLSVDVGTWPPGATFTYEWYSASNYTVFGSGPTWVPTSGATSHSVRVKVSVSIEGYMPVTVESEPVAIALGTFDETPAPTIVGTPTVGRTLTANVDAWVPNANFTYWWFRDGVGIKGAYSATYTLVPADANKQIDVMVTGRKTGWSTTEVHSASVTAAEAPFAQTATPIVTGTPAVGVPLNAATGTWSPSASLEYTWYALDAVSGTADAVATGSTYTPAPSDLGKTMYVKAEGSALGYATESTQSAPFVVAPGTFASTPEPTISGTAIVGSTLTAIAGTWSPAASLEYQWYRNGGAIPGANSVNYTLVAADATMVITVKATASAPGYASASRTSTGVTVTGRFTTAPLPTVTGTLLANYALTVKPGTWSPTPTSYSYRWYRNGEPITGATKSSYVLTAADRGTNITVSVTAKRTGYETAVTTSASKYIPRIFSKTVTPTITGKLKSGYTLTAHRGTWSPTPSYSYQWYRNGVKISNATKYQYKLTKYDKGKKVTVKVSGKRSGYVTVTKTSASKTVSW